MRVRGSVRGDDEGVGRSTHESGRTMNIAKPIIVRPDPDSVLSAAKWVLGIYAHCPPFYSELPAHPFCFNLRRALLRVFLMSRKIADQ